MIDDTRAQYDAAVKATGVEHPSQVAVMFQLMRRDEETQLAFMDRVNAILAHHPDRRAELPEVRIERALRELGSEYTPDPDWQARVWARIEREHRRRNRWYRRLWRWLGGGR